MQRHNRDYGFFCNVSSHTLRDEAFLGQFIEFLSENLEFVDDLISLASSKRRLDQLCYLQEDLTNSRVTMIVEKIETEPQLVELLDYNIRFGQGYLFGEPRESKH